MNLFDFDYDLPPELIAQTPIEPRDASRLLVVPRTGDDFAHRRFGDLPEYLRAGDLLVFNQTRVIPARLRGRKVPTGGTVELLLLRPLDPQIWVALVGGRGVRRGTQLEITGNGALAIQAEVTDVREGAQRTICFSEPIAPLLDKLGEVPLPPYIHEPLTDPDRYQTIYARQDGSAAAPTAGLHFTPELLLSLRQQGVQFAYCTLHIGLDTFQPVRTENITEHRMHSEWAFLAEQDARRVNETKLAEGRVIAVGTTVVRTLESAAILSAGGDPTDGMWPPEDLCPWRPVMAFAQETRLFIYPGYRFRVVDGMITNFHLPRSTLLMLVSAFLGREHTLKAYAAAREARYRFYSFGDAMLAL